MNIEIDGTYNILTDDNNFILQELKFFGKDSKNEGDSYYKNIGYYGNLQSALKAYLKYSIRTSTYGGAEIKTIDELIIKINSIEEKIDMALAKLNKKDN